MNKEKLKAKGEQQGETEFKPEVPSLAEQIRRLRLKPKVQKPMGGYPPCVTKRVIK